MKNINSIVVSGRECLPLIEGGKGISVSSGESRERGRKQVELGPFLGSMLILTMKMEI